MNCTFCHSDHDVRVLDDEHRACAGCRTGRAHPAIRPPFRFLLLDANGYAVAELFAHTQQSLERRIWQAAHALDLPMPTMEVR